MKKICLFLIVSVLLLAGAAYAEDVEVKLGSGSDSFVVKDNSLNNVASIGASGNAYLKGNVGIGTTAPGKKLTVENGSIRPAVGTSEDSGICFPPDPGGGGFDRAFMRYFVESGEITRLKIGIDNDADDRLSLYQMGDDRLTIYNGNVGIGTPEPQAKLQVQGGDIKVFGAQWEKARLAQEGEKGVLTLWDTGGNQDVVINSDGNSYLMGGNVGIGTANPEFKLSVGTDAGIDGGIIAKGTYGSGQSLSSSGLGTRLIWYPRKAAFRAGYVSGDKWDNTNIGDISIALGSSPKASANYTTAIGNSATASQQYAIAIGNTVTASGNYSMALGYNTIVSGANSFGIGLGGGPYTIPNPSTMAIMGGNVGIGTPEPGNKLVVDAGATFAGGVTIKGSSSDTGLLLTNYGSGGRSWSIDSTGTGSLYGAGKLGFAAFQGATPLAVPLVLTDSGNVGIGTLDPSTAKLVVNAGAGVGIESNTTTGIGVLGKSTASGVAIWANCSGAGTGIFSYATGGTAGDFYGPVVVHGNLSKTSGSFIIDHPLDPKNKVLRHSFIESPDMKNIYDGIVKLDNNGEAIIELPDYFEALNKDFRYQLTSIGEYAPVYIKKKVKNNSFVIAGGKPGLEISWQVTGIRQDAYARKNPIIVEEEKGKNNKFKKGEYLNPEAFGVKNK